MRAHRDEGMEHLQRLPREEHVAIHWGMCLAAYPFFGLVAETTGRLLRLQGTVAAGQVQRRLREQLGERETVTRATRRILRSFVDWSTLRDTPTKGLYCAAPMLPIPERRVTVWLLEAVMRGHTRERLPLRMLAPSPALFPFVLNTPLVSDMLA